MKKVLLPWPTDEEMANVIADAKVKLAELRRVAEVTTAPIVSEQEWFEKSEDAYAITRPRIKIDSYPAFLQQAKELKMIQTPSVGYNGIDIAACTEHGVVVCNVAEIMAESVAQHTWALILDVSKNVSKSDRVMRSGGWMRHFGIQLFGKTLGLVGIGDIGGRVALKGASAFGMNVLAYDPFVLTARAQLYGATLVDLETVLKESDVISINCPLTRDTHHLIQAEQLKLLKPTAILVNTARGPIINELDLIAALENQQLFGAGLDVFEEEPLSPTSPLRKFENVVISCHISSSTKEAFRLTWKGAVNNILRCVKGQRPHWIVNPSAFNL
jgi:lactate dehydrogenase-like 2-hydroxyacid dehydrogenase